MSHNSPPYSLIARILHWLVAGLIISQYILAELAENAEHAKNAVEQLALWANHKSIGMTILALAVLRVVWRVFNQPAALPEQMPNWQHRAASATHWVLYGLIFALPISGWLLTSAYGYSVSWFNVFTFPDFLSVNKPLAANITEIHEILGEVLFVLAVVHVVAALKHHFIDKDDVLRRMANLLGWLILIATIALTIGLFGRLFMSAEPSISADTVSTDSQTSPITRGELSDLPIWQIDYSQSYIKFTGDQAGAPFNGEWQRWTAEMQFDAEKLKASRFSVDIDSTSAFSNDQERDGYIASSDFFDAKKFSQINFYADKFSNNADGRFVADAQLSIKGLTMPVEFTFTVSQENGQTSLLGSAKLDRLLWHVGIGDWADATWVGHEVEVSVRVVTVVAN